MRTFVARGVLAGICVGMGGCIFLNVGGVVGAILFAFGLIAVVTLKLNLFTGKAQFVWNQAFARQFEEGGYGWLFSILALNIIGCIIMGLLMSNSAMQEAAMAVIDRRLSSSPLRNAVLAVGCGFIMTLAVQGTTRGKWLPLLFGIPAFILCGFPHCVADAFYIASLPGEYLGERAGDLGLFYVAIVAGNFVGCNAYRLIRDPQPTPSSVSVTSAKTETGS